MVGYVNNLTRPKSSPLASILASAFRHTALTSVPSAFSGHAPIVWNVRLQFCVAHFTSHIFGIFVICRHNVGFPRNKMKKREIFSECWWPHWIFVASIATRTLTVEELVVARVRANNLTVRWPIHMLDKTRMSLESVKRKKKIISLPLWAFLAPHFCWLSIFTVHRPTFVNRLWPSLTW